MNPRKEKKEIVSVIVDEQCKKTMPCQHDVTVKYADGSEKQKVKSAPYIANTYGAYLSAEAYSHFSFYRRERPVKQDVDSLQICPRVCMGNNN